VSNRHLDLDPRDLADAVALQTQPAQLAVVERCRNHAKKVFQKAETVNIFRSLFFTFFDSNLEFTLDNLDASQEKSCEKMRFFSTKCLTTECGHGRLAMWGDPLPPDPKLFGGSRNHAKVVGTVSAAALFSYPY